MAYSELLVTAESILRGIALYPISNTFSFFVITLIIGGFIFFLRDLKQKKKEIGGQISLAIKNVSFDGDPEVKFQKEFYSVHLKMMKLPYYTHAWKEFKEHVIFGVAEDENEKEKPVVFNSILPDVFFSQDVIVYENINQKFHDAIPGYLTGLGILGTFIGFSFALAHLDLGGTLNQDSIKGLLKGAETAFHTSVAGIFFSILYSFIEKKAVNELDNKANDFIDKLERCVRFTTQEQKQEEVIVLLKGLSNNSDAFVNDFISKLEHSFSKMLESQINQGSSNIVNALNSIKEIQESGQKDMLKKISEDLSGGLQSTASDAQKGATEQFQNLQSSFQSTVEKMLEAQNLQQIANEKMQRQMSETSSNITNGLESNLNTFFRTFTENARREQEGLSSKMEKLIQNLGEASESGADHIKEKLVQSASDISSAFDQISTRFIDANMNLAKTVEVGGEKYLEGSSRVSSGAEVFRSSLSNLQEHVKEFKEITNSQISISSNNQGVLTKLDSSLESIGGLTGSLGTQIEAINLLSGSLKEERALVATSNETVSKQWQDYTTRFREVDTSLENSFLKIKSANDLFTDQYKNLIDDIVNKVSTITSTLSQAIEDLSDALDTRKD